MTTKEYTAVRKGVTNAGTAANRNSCRNSRLTPNLGAGDRTRRELGSRLPNDLTEWTGSLALVRLVLQAVSKLGPSGTLPDFQTATGRYRPNMLLTLLTYAYAKGLTGSRGIELAIPTNKALKYIAAGARPDWLTLRLFRRRNVGLIRACLAEVFRQAWEQRNPSAPKPLTDGSYAADALGRWESEVTPDFDQAAAKRLSLAIQTDTLIADE